MLESASDWRAQYMETQGVNGNQRLTQSACPRADPLRSPYPSRLFLVIGIHSIREPARLELRLLPFDVVKLRIAIL